MNPFWKAIVGTLLGGVSLIAAHYSADWVANNTYRAHRAPQALAAAPRPTYAPAVRHVTVPNYSPHNSLPPPR